jgi:tetratricopeptide (TPR) repeat protein
MGGQLTKVSDNPVLAVSIPRAKADRRALGASARGGGGFPKPLLFLLVLAVLAGGGYGLMKVSPDLFSGGDEGDVNPFRRVKSQWSLQFPDVEGTSEENVVEGRKYMREDTAAGYRRADEHFRKALLLDVGNINAISSYVENFSYLPNAKADADAVALGFDGIDWAKKKEPDNASLLRAEGALRLAIGAVDEAQRVLVQARRVAPDDAMAKVLLARTHLDRSVQDALTLVRQVQADSPDIKQTFSVAGAAHRRLGNFREARAALQERLASDAGNVASLKEMARLELDLGEGRKAVGWLDKLVEAEQSDVEAHLIRAKITYQVLGENPKAREQLKFVLENYEKVAGELLLPALTHAAYLAALAGDLDEAQSLAERARSLNGGYTPAHVVLGRVLMKKDMLKEAQSALETAVQQLQSGRDALYEPVARALLGDVQVLAGDEANATRSLSRVIEYDPRSFRGYFGLAALHMRAGRASPAFTVMRKALDIDPRYHTERPELTDYPESQLDLLMYADSFAAASAPEPDLPLKNSSEGIVRYHAGQRAQARVLLNKALAGDRYNHPALLYLSVMDYEDGKIAGVEKRLKRATSTTAGSHTITQLYLARAELLGGKLKDAEKRLTDVLDNEPTLAQGRFTMGQLMLKRKKTDEALELWKQVVEKAPDYLPVKRAIAETRPPEG